MNMYPVLSVLDDLKQSLQKHPVVILQAPTGAGKSTVLPLELYDEDWCKSKKIIMLEPRRLAARSVAMRMASLLHEDVGETVGYRVRFETRVSQKTRIEVVTEGILTRMIQSDNTLDGVGMVVFDEFHERNLNADLALALSLQVQHILRPDLKILIMSATLEGQSLNRVFPSAPMIRCEGRLFPVELYYDDSAAEEPVPFRCARAIRKALREQNGDILVFLPGANEINRTTQLLQADSEGFLICPLYGDLPYAKQQEAIVPHPKGKRKIILATSIAETSLTIENVSVVIDSGLSRIPRFDPRSGLTRLHTVKVSADSAAQRAGRAGRMGPGFCYRLWSRRAHEFLVPRQTPEILEADLAPMLLEMAAWGGVDPGELTWITTPPAGAIKQALNLLTQLGALESDRISPRGREMVRMPTHPRISHMLLEASHARQRLTIACDVAALLEERDPLPPETGADLSLRLDALKRYREQRHPFGHSFERIVVAAANWRRLMKANAEDMHADPYTIGALLSLAYPDRIAQQLQKHSDRYKMANGRIVQLPAHDPLIHEEWLVAAHVDAREGDGRIFLAAPIDVNDLVPLANEEETVRWDDRQGRLVAIREKKIGSLIIESRAVNKIPESRRIEVLCDVLRESGLDLLGWDESQRQLQARMMSLKKWRPEEAWPDVSHEALLQNLESWIAPSLRELSKKEEFAKIRPFDLIVAGLEWELTSRIDRLAPERLKVPSGSLVKINYSSDGRFPVMEVRLQEIFGWKQIPTVNEGRVPLMLHLLSPGYRAVQITQDLQSFWVNTYPEVRKELRRRYPKHSWPEDPLVAQPIRGARKRKDL